MPQPTPRIVVGGKGPRKTPRLAARYADELNAPFLTPAGAAELRGHLDRACEAEDRDPKSIDFTLMTGCMVGATEQEYRARLTRFQQQSGEGGSLEDYEASLAGEWVLGTPERAAQRLGELRDAGAIRVLLQHRLVDDLDMLDLVANEIAPRV